MYVCLCERCNKLGENVENYMNTEEVIDYIIIKLSRDPFFSIVKY